MSRTPRTGTCVVVHSRICARPACVLPSCPSISPETAPRHLAYCSVPAHADLGGCMFQKIQDGGQEAHQASSTVEGPRQGMNYHVSPARPFDPISPGLRDAAFAVQIMIY